MAYRHIRLFIPS